MVTWEKSEDGKQHTALINGEKIKIREAADDETPKICTFIESVSDDTFHDCYDPHAEKKDIQQYYEHKSKLSVTDKIFIAVNENEINGVIGMTETETNTLFPLGKVATCRDLVHEKYQGLGIGKKLMEVREEHLRNNNFLYETELVHDTNKGHMERLADKDWEKLLEPYKDDQGITFWKAIDPQYRTIDPGIHFNISTNVFFYPDRNMVKAYEDGEFIDLHFQLSEESKRKIAGNKENIQEDDEGEKFFELSVTFDSNQHLNIEFNDRSQAADSDHRSDAGNSSSEKSDEGEQSARLTQKRALSEEQILETEDLNPPKKRRTSRVDAQDPPEEKLRQQAESSTGSRRSTRPTKNPLSTLNRTGR